MIRKIIATPSPSFGFFLLGIVLLATLGGWWQNSRSEPWALRIEVLPETVLEVAPPDWEALAAESEGDENEENEGPEVAETPLEPIPSTAPAESSPPLSPASESNENP